MRNPDDANLQLDVTDNASITKAIQYGIEKYGSIDVLVNNAGYGACGPLEGASEEKMQHQFDVNVFGVIRMTKAILPHFRKQRSGRIINISSMAGRIALPLGSLYHSSKYAVEGLSESLNFELQPLRIDVKLVEPGAVKTDFYGRSLDFSGGNIADYAPSVNAFQKALATASDRMFPSTPLDIAKAIYKAATTKSNRMRYLVGRDAKMLVFLRNVLGVNLFGTLVRKLYKMNQ